MRHLESESYPSISEVIPSLEGIKKKLEQKKQMVTHGCVKSMIEKFIDGINKRKPSYSTKEWIATYLNPNFKNLSVFDLYEDEIENLKNEIREEVGFQPTQRIISQLSTSSEDCVEQFKSHQYLSGHKDELFDYDNVVIRFNVHPLTWWKENQKAFPHLVTLARKYLAIQASSGSIERRWNVAESIDHKKRGHLSNEAF